MNKSESAMAGSFSFKAEKEFFKWLKDCSDKKITVGSICNGAFALGYAGLLKDTECTTHWRRVTNLQQEFPQAKVLSDILFVKSNNVYKSTGISAVIDLALAIVGQPGRAHNDVQRLAAADRRDRA